MSNKPPKNKRWYFVHFLTWGNDMADKIYDAIVIEGRHHVTIIALIWPKQE
jgi:hypothetical protein